MAKHNLDRQERQYLLLYMSGISKPIRLAISAEGIAAFQSQLYRPKTKTTGSSPFYWLSSFDGKEVLISLPDVEYVNFLLEIEQPLTFMALDGNTELSARAKADETDGTVDIYLRRRSEPASIRVDNSPKLTGLFRDMTETGFNSPFLSFTDDQGALVAFRPEKLVLMVAHRGSVQMTSDSDYEDLFRLIE